MIYLRSRGGIILLKRYIDNTKFLIQSTLFRIFLILAALSNLIYVFIEIKKNRLIQPLLTKSEINQLEYSQINSFSNSSFFFETTFIIFTLLMFLIIFRKKYRIVLKTGVSLLLIYFSMLFLLNSFLSWLFNAPLGNLTQILTLPFIILLLIIIYYVVIIITRGPLIFKKVHNNN